MSVCPSVCPYVLLKRIMKSVIFSVPFWDRRLKLTGIKFVYIPHNFTKCHYDQASIKGARSIPLNFHDFKIILF